jgi:hypothetical protein
MDKIQLNAAMINQAEQLGKATTQSQALMIASDVARLKIKQDIIALEDAIASKDEARITAATKQLNEDLKILGTLQNQNIKLADIKSILDSLLPKDLINIANLQAALDLLTKINLASTGSKILPAAVATTSVLAKTAMVTPTATTTPTYTNTPFDNGMFNLEDVARSSLLAGLAGGAGVAGAVSGSRYAAQAANQYNIQIQAGIGDPNAIAEAVTQVIQDAVDRGTLRGGSY